MSELEPLFENNARWAEAIKEEDPTFFEKLSKQQAPEQLAASLLSVAVENGVAPTVTTQAAVLLRRFLRVSEQNVVSGLVCI